MKYYDPDSMSKERRKEFLEWYEIHKHDTFCFQKEMQEYCISDVDILLQACWKFRQLLKDQTGKKKEIQDMEKHDFHDHFRTCNRLFLLSNNSFCMHGNFQR